MDGWMNWRKDGWKSERTGGGFDGLMDYSFDVKITSLFLILLYRLLVHWQPNKLQLPARIMKLQGKIDKGNIHRTASWNRNFINTIMSSCVVTWISRTSQCIFHDWLTDWKIINQGNYSGNWKRESDHLAARFSVWDPLLNLHCLGLTFYFDVFASCDHTF